MKNFIKYFIVIVLVAGVALACNTEPVKNDKDISILIDRSDPLKIRPDASELIAQVGLKQDIWQGVKIIISYVSNKDINANKIITLEHGDRLSGNTQLRTSRIIHFQKELGTALGSTQYTGSLGNSIIYRTVARQLDVLSVSTARNRYLLVYSDLMENDQISFYDPATLALLQTNPDAIRTRLGKSIPLSNFSGIQVWLLYDPVNYKDNNIYMAIATLYKQLLESEGATVHIGNTLNLS